MKIINTEVQHFTNIETAEHFMNILRSFKANQAIETTIIEYLEAINPTGRLSVANVEALYLENRAEGTFMFSSNARSEEDEFMFPIVDLYITTRTTINF